MAAGLDFRLLFESSPEVLLVLLPDAPRFTMVAATLARYAATMTTPEQTIGHGLFELFPDNPDDPSATGATNLRASLARVLATRAADTMAVQKYDIRGSDGTFQVRYWSPKNLPILSPAGDVRYILHRVEDVTELVRASELGDELRDRTRAMEREVIARSRELHDANRSLRDANARLGELDAAKTAFFGNVSHELRTPLTLMLGPIEDCLADPTEPLGPRHRARLQLVHANALRLLKLVNTLLEFSRLEAGRHTASFAPVELAELTTRLASMFQSAVDKAGLELVIDCPRLDDLVVVDREMWEKIVSNLLSNAFKYTHAGTIAVRLRDGADQVVVEVSDTGVGIPPDELPRIFDRFHRVAGTAGRSHEGTGIGLALVRELVELHDGRIEVESEVGRGTTFRVAIPRRRAPVASTAMPAPADRLPDASAHAAEAARWVSDAAPPEARALPAAREPARARILVVDDIAELRQYMSGLLEPWFDVATAGDGVAALESIRRGAPDLVVSDVMMPRLDGIGLIRALRADPALASIPAILVSARAGEEAAIEGLEIGADDYLIKPFSARELIARVRTHVELARSRRAWIVELERANRELDAFSYTVSHDLRAPLRAIGGFVEALVEDHAAVLEAGGGRYVERIRVNVTRMTALIEALLKLAKVVRAALHPAQVDLTAIAAQIVDDLRRAQPERAVTVEIEPELTARGDRALLEIALVNLLGNAWKFTGRTAEPRIAIGQTAPGTFFVRDNGAGFDAARAAELFEPFRRLHDDREFEGTGIGLATVHRVIARHGGRVWADSSPGQGATFHFTIPDHRSNAARSP